jgi:hypothetical protein
VKRAGLHVRASVPLGFVRGHGAGSDLVVKGLGTDAGGPRFSSQNKLFDKVTS